MNAFLKHALLLMFSSLVLVGCGGRGDDSADDDTTDPEEPVAASIELISSLSSMRSSGADTAELIAIVKDANNVVIEGITVNFQTSSGSIAVTQAITDSVGQSKASLTTSNDPSNRQITVTATVSGQSSITDSIVVAVTGTTLAISGPNAVGQGGTASFSLTLKDADGNGLANREISLSSLSSVGNSFSAGTVTTNAQGVATATYNASNGGSDTITAEAINNSVVSTHLISVSNLSFVLTRAAPQGDIPLNETRQVTLNWTDNGQPQSGETVVFTTTRGTVNGMSSVSMTTVAGSASVTIAASTAGRAVISATSGGNSTSLDVEFVAVTPTTIVVDAAPKTVAPSGQTSTITATLRDANQNVVKGQTVSFTVIDPSGGTINPATAITDSSGQATTTYTSNATTAQDGVTIVGTISGTALTDQVKLTVAQSPLFITIGTGNKLDSDSDGISYTKKYLVFVTDVNGNARPNQVVNLSVVPVLPSQSDGFAYNKGVWVEGTDTWVPGISVQCQNEDLNQNGRLDSGEDTNGNNDGFLTPGNVVSIGASSSSTGSVTTDADGYAIVSLRYAKEYGAWVQVRLRASATVSGTESFAIKDFLLQVLAEDVAVEQAPPGRVFSDLTVGSPFGRTNTCSNAL